MATVEGFVPNNLGQGLANNGSPNYGLLDGSGAQVIVDFYLKALLDGKGYQVRAGTITTPLIGDVVVTDTAAEFCIDTGAASLTLIPVEQFISIRLGTGTLHEYATKQVSSASTAGTAFVPLLLKTGGNAASSTARVTAAGGVTVTAELATTTVRHWSYSNPVAVGAGDGASGADLHWQPRGCIVRGTAATPRCLYTQIAATGTGPSYYANLDYLEFVNTALGAQF